MLEQMVKLLKLLQVATTALCESQIVSVSLVYPVINKLLNKLLFASSDDLPQVKALKEKVSAEIKCRFTPESLEIEDNAPLLAAAIDPKYHQLNILSDTQHSIIHDALKEKAEMMLSPDDTEDIEPASKKKKPETALSFRFCENKDTSGREEEIERFLREPTLSLEASSLEW